MKNAEILFLNNVAMEELGSADIKAGMDTAGRAKSLFIEDREQAIRAAIMMATEGATILLAGKGHETYQIGENGKVHFDEREIVMDAFNQNQ